MASKNKVEYLGNKDILKCHKVAFLCSRRCPAEIILKSYDWAIEQREKGVCVISGFHSKIERDVLDFLLPGKQPIILVLARTMKKRFEPKIQNEINAGRLLVISPFDVSVKRASAETAIIRNKFMAKLADELYVAYAKPGGNLEKLLLSPVAMQS
jgi:predicted Rossmann fold nucleotide-binding protein DprA/Smf involved in DNA uptake